MGFENPNSTQEKLLSGDEEYAERKYGKTSDPNYIPPILKNKKEGIDNKKVDEVTNNAQESVNFKPVIENVPDPKDVLTERVDLDKIESTSDSLSSKTSGLKDTLINFGIIKPVGLASIPVKKGIEKVSNFYTERFVLRGLAKKESEVKEEIREYDTDIKKLENAINAIEKESKDRKKGFNVLSADMSEAERNREEKNADNDEKTRFNNLKKELSDSKIDRNEAKTKLDEYTDKKKIAARKLLNSCDKKFQKPKIEMATLDKNINKREEEIKEQEKNINKIEQRIDELERKLSDNTSHNIQRAQRNIIAKLRGEIGNSHNEINKKLKKNKSDLEKKEKTNEKSTNLQEKIQKWQGVVDGKPNQETQTKDFSKMERTENPIEKPDASDSVTTPENNQQKREQTPNVENQETKFSYAPLLLERVGKTKLTIDKYFKMWNEFNRENPKEFPFQFPGDNAKDVVEYLKKSKTDTSTKINIEDIEEKITNYFSKKSGKSNQLKEHFTKMRMYLIVKSVN